MKVILLGAPGAGKGTQAEKISQKFNIPAISTGYIIRHAIAEGTELGKLAKVYIDEGKLLPDDVVTKLLLERLDKEDCKNGFILDGYPRTLNQAKALDELGIAVDKVVSIAVSDDDVIARLSGRRECTKCGIPYHISHNKPTVEGICDVCGGELIQRADDNPETIKNRLVVYHETTEPLIKYYIESKRLNVVESQNTVEKTTEKVLEIFED
jgi:adenylate kinase